MASRCIRGFFITGWLAGAWLTPGALAATSPPQLMVAGESLLILGAISDATAEEFHQHVRQGDISRVLIASDGGQVEAALSIANEIRRRRLDVEVVGNCFSACANYIFPAGIRKFISGRGIVAWHGNMNHLLFLHAQGSKKLEPQALSQVQRLASLENAFFKSIGVDSFICWFAKLEPYNARNFHFLSAQDMARFGLTDIEVRPDYEKTDLAALHANTASRIQFVRVDWEKLQRPNLAE